MPILTRAQLAAQQADSAAKENTNSKKTKKDDDDEDDVDSEVIISSPRKGSSTKQNAAMSSNYVSNNSNNTSTNNAFERAAGKRISKPTEFFEITYPERKPKRRQRNESNSESGNRDSSSSSGEDDGGTRLPPRAARLEFERRVKRGHLESDVSSTSSDSSDGHDSDLLEYRPARRGNVGTKNHRGGSRRRGTKRSNRKKSSSSSSSGSASSSEDDGENNSTDSLKNLLPTPKRRSKKSGSSKVRTNDTNVDGRGVDSSDDDSDNADDDNNNTDSNDDEDEGSTDEGEVNYDDDNNDDGGVIDHPNPREIERAVSGRVSINAKLADLLEAHRSKMELHRTSAGGDDAASGTGGNRPGGGGKKKNEPPKNIDIVTLAPVSFSDVGGVPEHIVALREMLLLPLTYPHLFAHLNIKPPRGVLFVGPPGNGKTLMARALAHECSRAGPAGGQPVTFFARKGADIMSKWVGEGERQLSQLFAEARRLQPSIIFFDEIDGLAPVRHMKQESSHASVVSTLLALMDGLDDRGQVVVIGATNRPDTLDPALRRPGRFDRELRFEYPNVQARHHILSIHTKRWNFPDSDLQRIAEETHGFAGADLSALVAEAALVALRRFCPHMFVSSDRFNVDAEHLTVTIHDFLTAIRSMTPSSHRSRNVLAMNDTPLRRCLGDSTANDVLVALRRHWHSVADELAAVDTADAEASFLRLVRPPSVTGMAHRSALILFTVESAVPQTSAVEANAACSVDFLGRTFPGALVCSFNFASGHVAGIEPSLLLEFETSTSSSGCFVRSSTNNNNNFSTLAALLSYTMKHQKVILVLNGVESLPKSEHGGGDDDGNDGDEVDAPLRWMFDAVSHRDTAIIVPTSQRALHTHATRMESIFGPSLYSVANPFSSPGVRVGDLEKALEKVIIPDLCASCIKSLPKAPPVLSAEQLAVATGASLQQQQQQQLSLSRRVLLADEWHKIAYKRTQLRQSLREILLGLMSKGGTRFEMFQGPDLDLVRGAKNNKEVASLLRKWRRHYAKHPMNLQVISEKLDKEQYCAVSQFNSDIEQICRNVTSFFSTDKASRRYRDRAKQMKEDVLLANYKLNRSIALFCEDHVDSKAPAFLSSSGNNKNSNSIAVSKNVNVNQQQQQQSAAAMLLQTPNVGSTKKDVVRKQQHGSKKSKSVSNRNTSDGEGEDDGDDEDDDDAGEVDYESKHNKKTQSYRSRSASRKSSAGTTTSSSKNRKKQDDDDDDADVDENGQNSDDNDKNEKFPSHGLQLRATIAAPMLSELKQALRQAFKLPAKATENYPVGQSLSMCEQTLVYEFVQHNDTVKRIRSKIEANVSSASSPHSQVPTVASGSSSKTSSCSGRESNGGGGTSAAPNSNIKNNSKTTSPSNITNANAASVTRNLMGR